MRTKDNPLKQGRRAPEMPDFSLCVLTHFTADPYHNGRMEVVRLCLDSMLAGAVGYDTELVIWDNGSTKEFREEIQDCYHPSVFVASENVGKDSGQRGMQHIARGSVWSYCDDDIYFYPNWLESHLEILQAYPNVGAISGSPQRTAFRWGIQSNLAFSQHDGVSLKTGRLIPELYEREYCDGIGRDYDEHVNKTLNDHDYLLEYNGVKAWAHSHHMQFIGYRERFTPVMKHSVYLVDDARRLDTAIDNLGFLRLTTFERTTLHIGNQLDENIKQLAIGHGLRKE